MFIQELKTSITVLPGVGKAASADYCRLGISTLADLLLTSPRLYDDRSVETTLDTVKEDKTQVNTLIKVLSQTYFGARSGRDRTLKVTAEDCSGRRVQLLCFGRNFLERSLVPGSSWYLIGTVNFYGGALQCSSFEVFSDPVKAGMGKILPIYPLAGNLSQRILRRDVSAVLQMIKTFEDELPPEVIEKHHLMHTDQAIREIHYPTNMGMLAQARHTLAFTELFYIQLSMKRSFPPQKRNKVINIPLSPLEQHFITSLPFRLTSSQEEVLREIRTDLDCGEKMNRLLQGDVGCGKTLVAWLSSLHEIQKGGQVAFMAPTELLARQHAEKAAALLLPLGVRVAFMTGDVKGKSRKEILANLKEGNIDILIGTHALFSKDVVFKHLAYAIIDEQHRFGVEQRAALLAKGEMPHLLLMSATPIPRTLALTMFGDLAISTIKTMPEGRKPIITHLVPEENREKMYRAIGVEFARSHQAYFVYPRIDDEGESELRDVTNMFSVLKEKYPGVPSALIHSKLAEEEKIEILTQFQQKKLSYLVSTSVVEVGIDIPDATCMIIEHADRFGLAALHQLRGRVGRSALQSYCFLVFGKDLSEDAKQRLLVMKNSNDGFLIAEKDLSIRGPGEISGMKQSGFLRLHFASLADDIDTLAIAKEDAERIINEDRGLIAGTHACLRTCLPYFEEDSE